MKIICILNIWIGFKLKLLYKKIKSRNHVVLQLKWNIGRSFHCGRLPSKDQRRNCSWNHSGLVFWRYCPLRFGHVHHMETGQKSQSIVRFKSIQLSVIEANAPNPRHIKSKTPQTNILIKPHIINGQHYRLQRSRFPLNSPRLYQKQTHQIQNATIIKYRWALIVIF